MDLGLRVGFHSGPAEEWIGPAAAWAQAQRKTGMSTDVVFREDNCIQKGVFSAEAGLSRGRVQARNLLIIEYNKKKIIA